MSRYYIKVRRVTNIQAEVEVDDDMVTGELLEGGCLEDILLGADWEVLHEHVEDEEIVERMKMS